MAAQSKAKQAVHVKEQKQAVKKKSGDLLTELQAYCEAFTKLKVQRGAQVIR